MSRSSLAIPIDLRDHAYGDFAGGDEDFRYLEEGVEGLPEHQALTNADTFVALVFDDILEQVKVFRFRPGRI